LMMTAYAARMLFLFYNEKINRGSKDGTVHGGEGSAPSKRLRKSRSLESRERIVIRK